MDNQRNMILAIVLSAIVLFGWSALAERYFPTPKPAQTATAPGAAGTGATSVSAPVPGAAVKSLELGAALSAAPRIAIETPSVRGSISLKGARIDDLVLLRHTDSVKKNAAPIRLLAPDSTEHGYFADFGWTAQGSAMPGPDTLWQADGQRLTPATPVTLRWDNGQGQLFAIKYSVDRNYMFTVEQSVTNSGTGGVSVAGFGRIIREHKDALSANPLVPRNDVDSWTMHVGPIGAFNQAVDFEVNYSTVDDAGPAGVRKGGAANWLGFGQTYWLTALVPPAGQIGDSGYQANNRTYQADYAAKPVFLEPGKSTTTATRLFAGAKEVDILNAYQKEGLANFGNAIDWGWFAIIEKPIFYLLDWLFKLVNNFGFAIILLTFIVRGLMFPIAQRQFASMAGMRAVQPKLKALQERYKDDKPRLQQEMMKLYQEEKINPLGGCLPILIQIPIFYALYKVLMVTIEMRHQPFIGWIKDLSAPDPANLMTLAHSAGATWFPAFLGIGILSGLLGLTMWMQFKLNPAAPDPVQQQVFSIMPWIMMFLMAPFAAGLQLYWVVSNILTIAQQKWLYSKHPALKEPVKP